MLGCINVEFGLNGAYICTLARQAVQLKTRDNQMHNVYRNCRPLLPTFVSSIL